MLAVLVWNSTRVTGNALADIFQERIDTLVPMLNVSLTNPLIQRDYATLDERLGRIVRPHSLVYIEVRDELGNKVASRGEVPQTSQLDDSFKVSDHVYDQAFDITLAGRVIGRARYGLNVDALEVTLASLRNQGAIVASVEIVLTVLLLATLGALLTRRLQMLAQAARALSGGDYGLHVPTDGQDEVADAARAFNAMTETLVRDVAVRKQSEVLLSGEKRVLEMIAEDAPLSDILEAITRNVEAASNQTLCSIMLLDADGVHLRHGAAPSLPVDFSRAVPTRSFGP